MNPVSLVIPVYNEARVARTLVARVQRLMGRLPQGSEAILVDDGSTDGSGELLLEAIEPGTPICLVRHVRNRGYGAALKTGIENATHEWIVIADADGTYPFKAIPKLLERMEDGARMAVGQRRLADQPLIRQPAKVFLNAFASYLAGTPVPDLNSGLRIFCRHDALRLRRLLPDGFSFTSTITMSLASEGARIDYLPIKYAPRVGESKIRPLSDMGGFLLLISRIALAFQPLRVFGPVSAVTIGLGFLLLVLRAVMAEPFGIASTILLLVGGLQVFAVGLLADLINRRGAA